MIETETKIDRNAALCRLTDITLLLERMIEDLDALYDQLSDSP